MNDFEQCQNELLDCQEETRGKRIKLIVGSKSVDAIIEADQNAFIEIGGGRAVSGSYMALVRKSDFPPDFDKTAQGTEVTDPQANTVQKILSITNINESWRLEIGEPAAEDA